MKRRRRHNRKGAATLEFAVVVPFIFLFFFSAFEYSRFNVLRHSAYQSAFEGARRGIVPGATTADVQAHVTKILDAVRIHGATISVSPTTITNSSPTVSVRVSVPVGDNSWVPLNFLRDSQFEAECTLRRETL